MGDKLKTCATKPAPNAHNQRKISNFVKNIKQNIITHGNKQNIHDD